jgi:hypothetical protein
MPTNIGSSWQMSSENRGWSISGATRVAEKRKRKRASACRESSATHQATREPLRIQASERM